MKHWSDYCVVEKNPIVWTVDYDITTGDILTPYQVKVVGCDFDKRCDVVDVVTGETQNLKWWKLFYTLEDLIEAEVNQGEWNNINPVECLLSNKNKALVKKMMREEESYYSIGIVDSTNDVYTSKFLQKALRNFYSLCRKSPSVKYYLWSSEHGTLTEWDGEQCIHWEYNKDSKIKGFHIKKYSK